MSFGEWRKSNKAPHLNSPGWRARAQIPCGQTILARWVLHAPGCSIPCADLALTHHEMASLPPHPHSPPTGACAGVISLIFDDPNTVSTPQTIWQERNQKILQTLDFHGLKAVLFVCGMRVNSPSGKALLHSWDTAGHAIADHSFHHPLDAYRDPLHQSQPSGLPAGESIVWSLVKQSGRFALRYPAEDGEYEKEGLRRVLRGEWGNRLFGLG